GPLGPWIVTADEIPDPTKLTLVTRLNGAEMQRSGTDMLIHNIPAIISFCSMFTPLAPGDIIATGTPDGIGAKRNPPVWMKAGDVLEVEVDRIGVLRNTIADEYLAAPKRAEPLNSVRPRGSGDPVLWPSLTAPGSPLARGRTEIGSMAA